MPNTIDLRGLVRPQLVESTKREDAPNVAEFRLQPLERGFGHTLGNAMRRLLLSSLRGAAVWGFRIDGVLHEHQTIPGVVEDVHQIIGQLKTLVLALDPDVDTAVLRIRKTEAGPVTAADIQQAPGVRVVEPEHHILTLQEDRELNVELYVNKGRGYVESDQHPVDRGLPVEARKILQEGISAGKIPANNAEYKAMQSEIAKLIANEGPLGPLETKAKAGGDGKLASQTGDAYLSQGNNAKAAELYRAALQKGGVNADEVNTRLGIALARGGDKAGAKAAFAAVQGAPRKDLASLWALHVDSTA